MAPISDGAVRRLHARPLRGLGHSKRGRAPTKENRSSVQLVVLLDLSGQRIMLMVVDKLRQRMIVHGAQRVAQRRVIRLARGERGPVDLSESRNERVAVLAADLAVLVAMAVV